MKPFTNERLNETFRSLDDRYNLTDESDTFKNLVNFSLSGGEPFHGWARYREGYSGELVRELIRRSGVTHGSHFVVDPMCGSGTTVVSARQAGFDAVGFDINDFAAYVSASKIIDYDGNSIARAREIALTYASMESVSTAQSDDSGHDGRLNGNAFRSERENARTNSLLFPVRFDSCAFDCSIFRGRPEQTSGEYCSSGKSDGIARHHRFSANR